MAGNFTRFGFDFGNWLTGHMAIRKLLPMSGLARNGWNPLAVAADVTWRATMDGQLIVHKGERSPGIILRLMHPKTYQGSISKP